LKTAGWGEAEITMATRVLRHNASRRAPAVLQVLKDFTAARDAETGERAAWERLVGMIEADPKQIDALIALLSL